MRYLRTQRGEMVPDIARSEGVTVKAVEKSLRMVAVDHALNTTETLQREAISSIRSNIPEATRAIKRLLNAKTLVRETKVINGKEITKIVTVDDTEVQVKGVNAWKDLLIAMQPKTPGGVNVNVNQSNANMAAATTTNIRTTTYEDRLRQIRNQQAEFAALPSQVIDAPEAADEEDEDDDPLDNEEDDDADSPAE
jgi:hypothetical protein